jgi:hypothetical protein
MVVVMMKNYLNLLIFMMLVFTFFSCDTSITDTNYPDNRNIEISDVNNSRAVTQNNSLASCPNISSSDFTTIEFAHKIRITYDDADVYPVVSWESDNPQTTTLDYDGGSWAYYHNNGYGFLEIKITVSSGGTNCTSDHVVYY